MKFIFCTGFYRINTYNGKNGWRPVKSVIKGGVRRKRITGAGH